MDDDRLNMSVRKFLKVVGVTSQREIEAAVRKAAAEGRLSGPLRARAVVQIESLGLVHTVEEEIETE